MTLKRTLLFLTLIVVCVVSFPKRKIAADDWLPIDPADLKMTSEPKAPGAPAIYLYRQVVRPRVLGSKAWALLETKEPRKYPVEFSGPERDADTFEINLPAGYVVDDLPPPTDVDYSFGSYHSKTETQGNVLRYTRTLEIRELSVPVDKAEDLKKFYRIIASDERSTAVLKVAAR